MNLKIVGVILAVFLMLISPTAAGFLLGGQPSVSKGELDKSDLETREIELYIHSTGQKKRLDFEEYIKGALLAETPADFEHEALKAMAVAIRSYCLRRTENGIKSVEHFGADVCDDYTHCLAYISFDDAVERWGEIRASEYYETVGRAVDETFGEILLYEGQIADAVFHASSAGYTESAENLWGFDIPYLVSVSSPENAIITKSEYSPEEFLNVLRSEGFNLKVGGEPKNWLGDTTKNSSGRVEKITVAGLEITGARTRETFGLASVKFDLKYEDGRFVFYAEGSGHGVGMSQYGCREFAEEGMTYAEILSHYYPGTELSLY